MGILKRLRGISSATYENILAFSVVVWEKENIDVILFGHFDGDRLDITLVARWSIEMGEIELIKKFHKFWHSDTNAFEKKQTTTKHSCQNNSWKL